MDMERKSITQLKALDEQGVGLARIATLNVIDSDGDITLPGAFGEQNVKVLPAHDWTAMPIGKAKIFEKGDEVLAEFKINLETSSGKDWHSALKFDLADGKGLIEWSYGFKIIESDTETRDGDRVRILKKLIVHEISPVMLGAGVNTETVAIKGDGKSGRSLVDQLDAALADVEAVNVRLAEVIELRAKDSRSLGGDSALSAMALECAIERTKVLSDSLAAIIFKGSPDEAGHLLAQFEASRLPPHIQAAINAVKK